MVVMGSSEPALVFLCSSISLLTPGNYKRWKTTNVPVAKGVEAKPRGKGCSKQPAKPPKKITKKARVQTKLKIKVTKKQQDSPLGSLAWHVLCQYGSRRRRRRDCWHVKGERSEDSQTSWLPPHPVSATGTQLICGPQGPTPRSLLYIVLKHLVYL